MPFKLDIDKDKSKLTINNYVLENLFIANYP